LAVVESVEEPAEEVGSVVLSLLGGVVVLGLQGGPEVDATSPAPSPAATWQLGKVLGQWGDTRGEAAVLGYLGHPDDGDPPATLARLIAAAPERRLPGITLAILAAAVERGLGTHTWRNPDTNARNWLTYLAGLGYTLSDIERKTDEANPTRQQVTPQPDQDTSGDTTAEATDGDLDDGTAGDHT
jgi:hypothetical protein